MNGRVIFHVDELSKWGLLLKNVQNLVQAAEGDSVQIEVLANSEAVKLYVKNRAVNELSAMQDLSKQGVHFVACNNALKGLSIGREQLAPFISVVPVGVLELIKKQSEGYAYIKP